MKTKTLFYLIIFVIVQITNVHAQNEWITDSVNAPFINFQTFEEGDYTIVSARWDLDSQGAVLIISPIGDSIIDYNFLFHNEEQLFLGDDLLITGNDSLGYINFIEIGDNLINNITIPSQGEIVGFQEDGDVTYLVILGDPNLVVAVSNNETLWTTEIESDPNGDIEINNDGDIVVGTDDGDVTIDPENGDIIDGPPTGIWNNSENINISVYPNPVMNHLTIEGTNNSSWVIYNIIGSQIQQGVGDQVDCSQLTKGNYILVINQKITKKIIKK